MEFRMGQLSGQVAVVGEQQHTGGITVQTAYRINTLSTSVTNDIDYRMTLLRIIRSGDGILRLIEQNIHLTLTTNRLIVETNVIRRQHFCA